MVRGKSKIRGKGEEVRGGDRGKREWGRMEGRRLEDFKRREGTKRGK